ncbi:unnamed protein product [Adineta ricciae]|uniref:Uncharacterized protein n=1 Tax=Adineta ricciae TaxID=249248 RepID=A0A813MRE3_ADIRI|nr:unnamed protein product [Adineta ricciae]
MVKCRYVLFFYLFIVTSKFRTSESLLQCYLCADCGDPFSAAYPYTSVVTNQNYGAACIKTVLTVPNGKLVSRGTTFSCTQASTSDIKVYCCQSDLCNTSNSLKHLTSLLLISLIMYLICF